VSSHRGHHGLWEGGVNEEDRCDVVRAHLLQRDPVALLIIPSGPAQTSAEARWLEAMLAVVAEAKGWLLAACGGGLTRVRQANSAEALVEARVTCPGGLDEILHEVVSTGGSNAPMQAGRAFRRAGSSFGNARETSPLAVSRLHQLRLRHVYSAKQGLPPVFSHSYPPPDENGRHSIWPTPQMSTVLMSRSFLARVLGCAPCTWKKLPSSHLQNGPRRTVL
jgi:hypothetical protein